MMSEKTFSKLIAVIFTMETIAAFAAGSAEAAFSFNTDLVGQTAVTTFGEMIDALEFPPAADDMDGAWVLTDPDGDAAFWWRKEAKSGRIFDVYL
jgi:hypothetical protein